MNSKVIMALAAAAALASCAKNEVAPVSAPEQEISYQTVTGPNTKAATQYSFSEDNVFVSYAYRLDGDKTWSDNKENAEIYIDGVTIGFTPGTGSNPGVWRSIGMDRYYWPDNGSLTFFAWSNNKKKGDAHASELVSGTVSCPKESGITVSGYDARTNLNFDFMVAVPQYDRTKNISSHGYTGVPTVFGHKMCQVKYSVKTNVEYTVTKFWIDKVKFDGICQKGNYSQLDYDAWTPDETSKTAYAYASSNNTAELGQDIYPETTHWDTTTEQYYFIPQQFTSIDQKVRIEYSIQTGVAAPIKYYAEKKLSEIFPQGWEKNKKYTIDIVLGLNEVLWDPAIEDWETGTVSGGDWSLIGGGTAI